MAELDKVEVAATIYARNIGGISETEVKIPPGVTILEGRNATNRTSFLQSIMAAMGSKNVSLKGDADQGEVKLTIGDETYTRTLEGENGHVRMGGDPYLDDPEIADLFAFLLESNEARRAVVRSENLRDLIMRPIDTDEIQAEIDRLERERDSVDEELETINNLKQDLPGLEQRWTELEAEIEEKRAELADTETEIESKDADVEETREEKEQLEKQLADLRDLRSKLEEVRTDINLQEESIESLRAERSELQEEFDDLPEMPMGQHQELNREIERLREQKQAVEADMSDIQDIIQFNEEMLDSDAETAIDAMVADQTSADTVTDQLVEDDSVVCWTCGSDVARDRITETVDQLRSVRQDYLSDVREIEAELDELQEQKRDLENKQRRRETLERKLDETASELDRRKDELASLREERDRLTEKVETTESEVEDLESDNISTILELHKEANQLEFELGRLESELDDVTDRITEIEDRIAEEEDLTDQRAEIQSELEAQRTRIDRIEQEAVEAFNSHMEEILSLLEYENLARIWIERVQREVREGRRKVKKSVFELHVIRSTDSGTTYEDTVDHLSESEREVTGLTFALAGYLVHDVHETVPFMLLDSLEAIDSERLADLISYFSEYVQYLVVALLPEDAQAVSDVDTRITDI